MKLLILFASLALARATVTTDNNKNDERSLLRGAAAGSVDVVTSSNQQDQHQHQHRSLQVILDPGGADCVPHSSGDGTFVCTIRTAATQQTQSDVDDATILNYNRVLREAGYVRYFNGKEHMCVPISSDAAAVPGSGGAVTAAGPSPSMGSNGVDLGMDMGIDSSGTQKQEQGGAFVTTTLTITNPTPIDTATAITAEVFSNPVVVEPEPEPEEAPMRSEQVGITLASSPSCPASQPGNGSGCQFYTQSSKCPYTSTQFPSGWLTCGCTKDDGWVCREYKLQAFSF